MGIPKNTLEDWSNQGSTTGLKKTLNSVKTALKSGNSEINEDAEFEIFVQGSYRNDTNVHGDSDIDIVIKLTSSFKRDLSSLKTEAEDRYHSTKSDASYGWEEFEKEVYSTLNDYYKSSKVSRDNIAIKIEGYNGRKDADILVCQEYRNYKKFPKESDSEDNYVEGVWFKTLNGQKLVNYPNKHTENGINKNQKVGDYKSTIRMFKNAKYYLIDKKGFSPDKAPSYFIECFLYNAPAEVFDGNCKERFKDALHWMGVSNSEYDEMLVQNEQRDLFGDDFQQWSEEDALAFADALLELWEEW